jgi:hypothetical protein
MWRWLSLTSVVLFALVVGGCGSHSTEIKPKADPSAKPVTTKESANKALQGMPPEMQEKMKKRMPR